MGFRQGITLSSLRKKLFCREVDVAMRQSLRLPIEGHVAGRV